MYQVLSHTPGIENNTSRQMQKNTQQSYTNHTQQVVNAKNNNSNSNNFHGIVDYLNNFNDNNVDY